MDIVPLSLKIAYTLFLCILVPVYWIYWGPKNYRLGYDDRAWLFQTVVALIVLPLTYWLTDPADNVNWVYGPGSSAQTRMHPRAYLVLAMILFPLVVYLPTHLLLRTLFGPG